MKNKTKNNVKVESVKVEGVYKPGGNLPSHNVSSPAFTTLELKKDEVDVFGILKLEPTEEHNNVHEVNVKVNLFPSDGLEKLSDMKLSLDAFDLISEMIKEAQSNSIKDGNIECSGELSNLHMSYAGFLNKSKRLSKESLAYLNK